MAGLFLRTLVALDLDDLSILAPIRIAGVVALLGQSEGRVMVICTGDGLRTIRIGPDEQPGEGSGEAEYCAMTQAVDTASAAIPPSARSRFLFNSEPVRPRAIRRWQQSYLSSLPRGPPRA